jgi:hypothetical protein
MTLGSVSSALWRNGSRDRLKICSHSWGDSSNLSRVTMNIEKITADYKRASATFDAEATEAFDAPTLEQYMARHARAYKKYEPFKLAYNAIREPEYCDLSTYGNHYTLKDFVENCLSGGFIDYDGHGRYATATQETNIGIVPSDVTDNVYIKDKYTHVMWFNK